ncbi:MAG: fumarylacetoacetate hydrolase family protein [Bacteroidia bacterium]|nr:fumarylacetoacetate hydrolase family protein [Bacteroidia bacterium]
MKMICVGRNYAEHARELGNEVPENPLIFIKPDTALLKDNQPFYHPDFSNDIHYECELVFRVSREGKYIQEKFASTYLDGVGLGIDFTARDLQNEAKQKGLPWTLSKCFNHSAPVSNFLPLDRFPDLQNIHFECRINGDTRQVGDSSLMIYSINYLVAFISRYITLKKGDYIFTGTPAGVGKINVNDHIQGFLEGEKLLDFQVK